MRVSARGEYGIRAMVAFAHSFGQGPRSVAVVSRDTSIPSAYLEQLVAPLRAAGLVESKRGAQGGYQLTRPPDLISVGEIYRALEGPVAPMDCVSENIEDQTCPLIPACETRPVWISVRDAIASTIDGMTLGDLIREKSSSERVLVSSEESALVH